MLQLYSTWYQGAQGLRSTDIAPYPTAAAANGDSGGGEGGGSAHPPEKNDVGSSSFLSPSSSPLRSETDSEIAAAIAAAVRKTASFFEFSLCLSRACFGKMIVFIYKWQRCGKQASLLQPVSFAFVPSLSWQIIAYHHRKALTHEKRIVRFLSAHTGRARDESHPLAAAGPQLGQLGAATFSAVQRLCMRKR
jgi:hypothetical protein